MLEPLLKEQDNNKVDKPEIERVQQEKQEHKLIGHYLRTRGLKLYSYSTIKDILSEVIIQRGNTIHLVVENNKLVPVDFELEKSIVDSRNEHFEALNLKNAKKRVSNYKQGKIKELCNLREPGDGINFY